MGKSFMQKLGKKQIKANAKPIKPDKRGKTVDMFDKVHLSDMKYVKDHLELSPPLAAQLASMMRDGTLEKTLFMKMAGGQHYELGKQIGKNVIKVKNNPPRFWDLLWLNIWKAAPPTAKGEKLTGEEHFELASYGLGLHEDARIPKTHKGAGYEGPLVAVLKTQHSTLGYRLSHLTPALYKAGNWGYFGLPSPFNGNVFLRGHEDVLLEIVPETKVAQADDWSLANNGTLNVTLESKKMGFIQLIFPVLRAEKGDEFVDENFPKHASSFEHSRAADKFPEPRVYKRSIYVPIANDVDTEGTSSASASSSTKPAAQVDGLITVTPKKTRRSAD